MNRRKALGVMGATATGLMAVAGTEAHAHDGHKHHASHEQYSKCAKANADCQVMCDSCFRHCAAMLAKGGKAHAQSMHFCLDCAELCAVAAKLVARRSALSAAACEACAKACDECAAACEKFPNDKHITACAKSCRACAKTCRAMVKSLSH